MIKTQFIAVDSHDRYEKILPYPVRVGDYVEFNDGVPWTVATVKWIIEENPEELDAPAFVFLLVGIK